MNTHYAMAAIFALGFKGIKDKATLPHGAMGALGVTRDTVTHLPKSLEAATALFAAPGSVAREVFGDEFVDHYAGTREHEVFVQQRAVTDWECEWVTLRS